MGIWWSGRPGPVRSPSVSSIHILLLIKVRPKRRWNLEQLPPAEPTTLSLRLPARPRNLESGRTAPQPSPVTLILLGRWVTFRPLRQAIILTLAELGPTTLPLPIWRVP